MTCIVSKWKRRYSWSYFDSTKTQYLSRSQFKEREQEIGLNEKFVTGNLKF